jgi:hypothetical protein
MSTIRIGFPVKCRYRGGNRSLGAHGRQLLIKDGQIGYGQFRLSRSIPIETVQRVEISERVIEGVAPSGPTYVLERSASARQGLPASGRRSAKGASKIFTDITVHTTDGQTALWVVEQRNADWLRRKLGPILDERRIRLA